MYRELTVPVSFWRRGRRRTRWLDGITDSMDMNLSELQEGCEGQGSLACCSLWGHKESDTTGRLNNNPKAAGTQGLGAHSRRVLPPHSVLYHAALCSPFINSFVHFQAGEQRQYREQKIKIIRKLWLTFSKVEEKIFQLWSKNSTLQKRNIHWILRS